jgi:glycosyltransferase involved in cell wall biosynthesis
MIVGGAQETVLLAAALADRSRFDPVVVTGPQTGSEGSLHEELAARGVEVVLVPDLVREVSPASDLRAVLILAELFRAMGADVVHTNSSKAGIVGRLAARRARVPRVLHTVHGWPFHAHQRPAVAGVWRSLERHTAPLAEHLVVVADADREKGLAAGIGRPDQYVTVRSGLELSLYGPNPDARVQVREEFGLPGEAVVLGAINRLSPQKDPLTLVRALAGCLRARPHARLLLVGDGPLRRDVEREVAGQGVSGQVVLTGLRRDVPRLLAALDVFVSASRWEGLPRTVLQATASGVPVLATSADGVADVVENDVTGLLVSPGDEAALCRSALRLVDDAALRTVLVERAQLQLVEFDAARMVRELEALYAGVEP